MIANILIGWFIAAVVISPLFFAMVYVGGRLEREGS